MTQKQRSKNTMLRNITRHLPIGVLLLSLLQCASGGAPSIEKIVSQPNDQGGKGELHIKIKGLRNDSGTINLVLFDERSDRSAFPGGGDGTGNTREALIIPATLMRNGSYELVLPDLHYGIYAVAVIHDENANGRLDYHFWVPPFIALTPPREGYAFSSNPLVGMGPPSFSRSAFEFSEKNSAVELEISYFWDYNAKFMILPMLLLGIFG